MSTAAVQLPGRSQGGSRRVSARSEAVGSVRLTRRGRLVVFAACLAAFGGGFTMLGDPAASTHTTYHPAKHRVVVQPGQTLWDIAKQVAPGQDPRTVIDEIVDLNALSSAGEIRAGQPLYVPAR
ncbi:MAG TPA: LysM peptidoglycan-binding domain-containing protein [Nocardioidaceae bacterium]|nr:LysM peptidoglycan-binding domain-containing protein [Nocardioidaceae bacterium]